MAEIRELFPHIKKDIEATVERADNVIDFARRVNALARRNWRYYRGEDAAHAVFGADGWHIAPSPCCVCNRVMGAVAPENGFFFYAGTNGEWRPLCIDCHRRWHNDNNEKLLS